MAWGEQVRCRVCGAEPLSAFFDLGAHPLANSLLATEEAHEEAYPLALTWCPGCALEAGGFEGYFFCTSMRYPSSFQPPPRSPNVSLEAETLVWPCFSSRIFQLYAQWSNA